MSRGKVLGHLENYGNLVDIMPSCQLNPPKNAARCDQTVFDDFLPERNLTLTKLIQKWVS